METSAPIVVLFCSLQAMKSLDSLVMTKASASYKEMRKTVEAMRTQLENIVGNRREEILSTREQVTGEIKSKVVGSLFICLFVSSY